MFRDRAEVSKVVLCIPVGDITFLFLPPIFICIATRFDKLLKHVQFELHDTFSNPIRTVKKEPFTLQESCYDTFSMKVTTVSFSLTPVLSSYLASVSVCTCVRACVRACVRSCVYVCMRTPVCMCVCVRARARALSLSLSLSQTLALSLNYSAVDICDEPS